jgi:hypothetical protein
MKTPLQLRTYELLMRTASTDIDTTGDWRIEQVARRMFESASEIGAWMERASGAPSRERFREALHEVHAHIRQVKLWLRVLDDLGRIDPEAASPLHDTAEEVQRLVVAALRTSAASANGVTTS